MERKPQRDVQAVKLRREFDANSRYYEYNEPECRYGIRVGATMIWADDTKRLFEKFLAAKGKGDKV